MSLLLVALFAGGGDAGLPQPAQPSGPAPLARLLARVLAPPVMVELPPAKPLEPRPEPLRIRVRAGGFEAHVGAGPLSCGATPRCATVAALRERLVALKRRPEWKDRRDVVLEVDREVPYQTIVEVMDAVRAGPDGRPLFPHLALSVPPEGAR